MKWKKTKFYNDYLWIHNLLENKLNYMTFLIIFIGIIIGAFSILDSSNFYTNIYTILHNSFFIIFFFICCCVLSFNIVFNLSENYFFVLRLNGTKKFINTIMKKLQIAYHLFFAITILLVFSVSILFCAGKFNLFDVSNVNIIFGIILSWVKFYLVGMLLCLIFGLTYFILKKEKTVIIFSILMVISLLLLELYSFTSIFSSFDIPVFLGICFLDINYSSISQEIMFFSIHLIFLSLIYILLYQNYFKKRRDII